jgi:mannose-1-phosphate guanylyltransferase
VANLGAAGVTEAVLALGFRPDAFTDAYPDGTCAGVRLTYAVEPEPLDTAGAIRFAARFAGITDTFVVVNGDVLTDLDVRALLAFHHAHGAEGTIHLTPVDDPSAFGVVPTDPDGRVIAFIEKPPRDSAPTNLINAGTYVLEASVIDRIPDGRKVSIERETFPAIVADGRLFAMATDDYWLDTGRPDLYLQANLDALAGVRRGGALGGTAAGVSIGGTVDRSAIGAGSVIEAGALVSRSVLLSRAQIGAGAHVEGSLLGHDVQVGAGAKVVGCVIGDSQVVAANADLVDQKIPNPT